MKLTNSKLVKPAELQGKQECEYNLTEHTSVINSSQWSCKTEYISSVTDSFIANSIQEVSCCSSAKEPSSSVFIILYCYIIYIYYIENIAFLL